MACSLGEAGRVPDRECGHRCAGLVPYVQMEVTREVIVPMTELGSWNLRCRPEDALDVGQYSEQILVLQKQVLPQASAGPQLARHREGPRRDRDEHPRWDQYVRARKLDPCGLNKTHQLGQQVRWLETQRAHLGHASPLAIFE
jgi:hypothetical protein